MDTAIQLAIQQMLSAVDTYRASDLHLSVGNPPMMRVAGKLVAIPEQPILTPDFMESMIMSWLDADDRERLARQKDLIIGKTFENRKRFRISVFYQQGHLSASLMFVPDVIPSLADFGLPVAAQRLVETPAGLVFIIGPYGSRQSLTAASFVEHLNQHTQKHVVTLEHPVEFLFSDNQCVIDQREIGKDVDSFVEGLHFTLEEDVDVVMVTDLSDHLAMRMALQVAGAGKTVFGIMNANTISTVLNAVIHSFEGQDQDQARGELAATLAGVVNQRTVSAITGDKLTLAEVMIPNESIRNLIYKGDIIQLMNVMQTSSNEAGIRTMAQALQEAVQMGQISQKDAEELAYNRLFLQ